MKKLDINLIYTEDELKQEYIDYIAKYKKEDMEKYIKEFEEWKKDAHQILTSFGQQRVIDKINELIEKLDEVEPILNWARIKMDEEEAESFRQSLKGI